MKTNHHLIALILLAALLSAGCGSRPAPSLAVPPGGQADQLTEMGKCEFQPPKSKTKYAAECGTLVVPENRGKTGSRLIALPVVRIPASGPNPAEPVFFLGGGPGLPNYPWTKLDWLLEDHDVVVVGYRGVDGTKSLACPEVKRLMEAHMGKDYFSEQARAGRLPRAGVLPPGSQRQRHTSGDLFHQGVSLLLHREWDHLSFSECMFKVTGLILANPLENPGRDSHGQRHLVSAL